MSNEFTFKSSISDEDLTYLMVAALEGGINYWCDKVRIVSDPAEKEIASDVIAGGGTIKLWFDGCDADPILTKEKLLKGVAWYCQENKILAEEMMEDHDADTADQIIQFAMFDEIVFG